MSFYSDLIDNIVDLVEQELDLYASIVYGSDPPDSGICMIPEAGAPSETFLDKGMLYRVPVILNGKNANQALLLDDLTAIHGLLTRRLDYSDLSTEDCQLVNIETMTLPCIIGREQNKQWICGSTFEVAFYWSK